MAPCRCRHRRRYAQWLKSKGKGRWDLKDALKAMFVMSGIPKDALLYLQTGHGSDENKLPWSTTDSKDLNEVVCPFI